MNTEGLWGGAYGLSSQGLFLERPGNFSGPKSNSWNYDPLAVKKLFFKYVSDIRKGKITAKFQSL